MEQQSNYIWVVVRHEIDYLRPLTVGHVVTAQTWVDATARGAQSNRYVRFTGADGKLCVAAATSWALINRVSGRLQRVPAELLARFQNKIC